MAAMLCPARMRNTGASGESKYLISLNKQKLHETQSNILIYLNQHREITQGAFAVLLRHEMTFKVESEMLFAPYTNAGQGNVQDLRATPGLAALNVTDAMLLQRLSDLAHVRQSQILQSQNEGWLANDSTIDRQFLAEVNGDNSSELLNSSASNNDVVGNASKDGEAYEEYGESDRDAASDVKAEASEVDSRVMDAKKGARASPQQRPHAAVEKRYRRTVNTKLQQLYMSIPSSGTFSPDRKADTGSEESDQAAKPVVLDKAIQYVQHLTETYLKYDADIEDLRRQLRDLAERHGIDERILDSQDDEELASDMA